MKLTKEQKLEAKLEAAAEAQLEERRWVVEQIASKWLDKSFVDSANLGLRYALEAAYEAGWQAGRKK